MPIDYDYTQHILYKDGKQEGKQDTKEEVIVNMLQAGKLLLSDIANYVAVSEDFVFEVKQKYKL